MSQIRIIFYDVDGDVIKTIDTGDECNEEELESWRVTLNDHLDSWIDEPKDENGDRAWDQFDLVEVA
ncbi:MAG TPA: hypothetical protein VN455_00970 [Methanotrichaceae archaeon]|nr:hypothetical protein [Methanotrichaceae archaeon]